MHPNSTKRKKNISLGSHRVDRVPSLRKIVLRLCCTNFCTRSAHFAPCFVRQPNGPKCTQIVQKAKKISLGSNGVDRVRSLRNIPMRLRGTNFCTSSARFAPSFVTRPNCPKCTQIVRNAPKHQFRVQWVWIGCLRCEKFQRDFMARTFGPVRPVSHRVS
jgi:hypothetical protein